MLLNGKCSVCSFGNFPTREFAEVVMFVNTFVAEWENTSFGKSTIASIRDHQYSPAALFLFLILHSMNSINLSPIKRTQKNNTLYLTSLLVQWERREKRLPCVLKQR